MSASTEFTCIYTSCAQSVFYFAPLPFFSCECAGSNHYIFTRGKEETEIWGEGGGGGAGGGQYFSVFVFRSSQPNVGYGSVTLIAYWLHLAPVFVVGGDIDDQSLFGVVLGGFHR